MKEFAEKLEDFKVRTDPLSLYFNKIKSIGLLSREEEIQLAQKKDRGRWAGERLFSKGLDRNERDRLERLAVGGQEATIKLIEANLRLVPAIVGRSFPTIAKTSQQFEDLIQEGNIGLQRAVEKYDWEKGKLSTYAVPWIRNFSSRALDREFTIHLPEYIFWKIKRMEQVEEHIWQKTGG